MTQEPDVFIDPVIGVELEHLAKPAAPSRSRDPQSLGVEAALRGLNKYVFTDYDPIPTYGISPTWNYYGASWDYLVCPNGGAIYDDLSQVEICTPCTLDPAEAYRHMCALEYAAAQAIDRYCDEPVYMWLMNRSRRERGGFVYRAGHVNIAMSRAELDLLTDEAFGQVLRAYMPFTIAVAVLLGSGAVGDRTGDDVFLRSQRLEAVDTIFPTAATTANRTLSINLRGFSESLSDEQTAIRNHIIGPHDSTVSPTMELRIALLQAATVALLRADLATPHDLSLAKPLQSAHVWNRDPWAEQPLESGARVNAMDVAEVGCQIITETLEANPIAAAALPHWPRYAAWLDGIITALRQKDLANSGVEWAAKKVGFADIVSAEDAVAFDILWHEITPGLFAGDDPSIARDFGHGPPFTAAILEETYLTPPLDTRAYLRGSLVRACIESGERAGMTNWDALHLPDRKQRVALPSPLGSTRAELGPLEGLDIDEMLQIASPQASSATYQHRSRVQHHGPGTQTVQVARPGSY